MMNGIECMVIVKKQLDYRKKMGDKLVCFDMPPLELGVDFTHRDDADGNVQQYLFSASTTEKRFVIVADATNGNIVCISELLESEAKGL